MTFSRLLAPDMTWAPWSALSLALCLSLGAVPGSARAAEPTPRDLRAAQCVAALEPLAEALARQLKAGQESARAPLMDRLTWAAAFVGDSFLNGNHDEDRSRRLTDQAREAQKRLSPAELATRQAGCQTEGAKLYSGGNAVQKAVLRRLARKRMSSMLGEG